MITYISGHITKARPDEARDRYDQAEGYLKELGHKPVNIFKIAPSPIGSIPARLQILINCTAIFLLEGWIQSQESRLEKYYSELTGKKVIFQSRLESEITINAIIQVKADTVKCAILEVTGMTFDQYKGGTRGTDDQFFARLLFSYQCKKAGLSPQMIVHFLERDRTTVLHHLKKYSGEFKFNPRFRELARKVDLILYPEAYHTDMQKTETNHKTKQPC